MFSGHGRGFDHEKQARWGDEWDVSEDNLNGRPSITEVRFKCSLWGMNQTAEAALRCTASVPGVVDCQTPAQHTQTHWLQKKKKKNVIISRTSKVRFNFPPSWGFKKCIHERSRRHLNWSREKMGVLLYIKLIFQQKCSLEIEAYKLIKWHIYRLYAIYFWSSDKDVMRD